MYKCMCIPVAALDPRKQRPRLRVENFPPQATRRNIYMYILICVCVCVCVCVCMSMSVCAYIYVCIHVQIRIRLDTCCSPRTAKFDTASSSRELSAASNAQKASSGFIALEPKASGEF